MNKTGIIIRREYLERVKKKSFIVTTIFVPVLMLLVSVLPALIMHFASSEAKTVAVVDDSGVVFPRLEDTNNVRFVSAWDSPQGVLAADSVFGVLIIEKNVLTGGSLVKLLSPESTSMNMEKDIANQVEKIIEDEKLKKYDIQNLDKILADVETHITVQTIRTDSAGEEGESQSAAINSVLGTLLNFLLYMFLLIYGGLVMNSIIEEKNNRVLELVVSTVTPTQLMLGKIVGVGLVALTQILIWLGIMVVIVTAILPALLPAGLMEQAAALNSGAMSASDATMDLDLAVVIGMFTNLGYILKLFAYLILFLVGGYLFYASIFAAIGASVDNIQDASQLQTIGVVPVLIGLIASMAILPDPNSGFAVVMSMIPFTSPMVMMARIAFDIPLWQVVCSIVILYASIAFMIWLAAKIYRVGIFMYGKKPTGSSP